MGIHADLLLVVLFTFWQIKKNYAATGEENIKTESSNGSIRSENSFDGESFYRNFIHTSTPVVFTKAAIHWPATKLWRDISYVKETYGEEILPTSYMDGVEPTQQDVKLNKLFEECKLKNRNFVSHIDVNSRLLNDIYLPSFLQCRDLQKNIHFIDMQVGRKHKSLQFQQADDDIILITISGRRRLHLYDHEFTEKFFQDNQATLDFQNIYPELGSESAHHLLLQNLRFNLTLHPGDIVYIPQMWWYHVKTLSSSHNIDLIIKLKLFQFTSNIEQMGFSKTKDIVEFSRQFHKLRKEQKKEIRCDDQVQSLRSALNVSSNENETLHLRIPKRRKWPDPVLLASGYKVPPIAFGTGLLFDNTTFAVKLALDNGYRMIDTAQGYPKAEQRIAVALREKGIPREDVVIITKLHPRFLGYKTTLKSIKRSLKALNTSYIDIYLIHSKDCDDFLLRCKKNEPNGTWQESWKAMEEAYKLGWIRSLGVSNFEVDDLKELVKLAIVPVSVVQNWFDPLHQDTPVRKFCAEHSISYQGYSTLGSTWLQMGLSYNPVLTSNLIIGLAGNYDYVPSHIVLRYAIHKGVTPITSSANPNHIAQNIRSLDISLHPREIEAIDAFDDAMVRAMQELEAEKADEEKVAEEKAADEKNTESSDGSSSNDLPGGENVPDQSNVGEDIVAGDTENVPVAEQDVNYAEGRKSAGSANEDVSSSTDNGVKSAKTEL